NRRHVRGGENAGIMRRCAHAGGPCEALKTGAVEIGLPAEPLPAADRHQRLELHFFGDLRQRQRVRPIDLQHAVDRGNRTAAVEIGAEGSKLELAVVENRVAASARRLRHRRLLPFWPLPGSTAKIARNAKSLNAVARNALS